MTAGEPGAARELASRDDAARLAFLGGVPLVGPDEARAGLRGDVLDGLDAAHPQNVRRAAIRALATIPTDRPETVRILAKLVGSEPIRAAAIEALLRIPQKDRPADVARALVTELTADAEGTPAAERTTDAFLDAMQLADELLAALPADEARRYRDRLRDVAVRVVRIATVQEEMRYDTPYFAVEAGRPVQVVLENEDLMPHNLVITAPGALRTVAEQAAALPPDSGAGGKQYVPDTAEVLFATSMVQSGRREALTFTAPGEPGEYPYVCTFPGHWLRMNGTMVVVDDLDAWLADPTEPADPLAGDRAIVRRWSLDDFDGDLAAALGGRQPEIGRRIFEEATCVQCHRMGGEGGAIGPDLADVLDRRGGDLRAVLREILEPSREVDPKYALRLVATADGQVVSGIVTAEDERAVTIVSDPTSLEPRVVRRRDIDEIVPSSTSMMPQGLLDRFTRDEIFDLLHYLEAGGRPSHGRGRAGRSSPPRAISTIAGEEDRRSSPGRLRMPPGRPGRTGGSRWASARPSRSRAWMAPRSAGRSGPGCWTPATRPSEGGGSCSSPGCRRRRGLCSLGLTGEAPVAMVLAGGVAVVESSR